MVAPIAPGRILLRHLGEAAALGIGEAKPAAAEVSFKDAVFLVQIRDDPLLVTLKPPSDHGDQDMENQS